MADFTGASTFNKPTVVGTIVCGSAFSGSSTIPIPISIGVLGVGANLHGASVITAPIVTGIISSIGLEGASTLNTPIALGTLYIPSLFTGASAFPTPSTVGAVVAVPSLSGASIFSTPLVSGTISTVIAVYKAVVINTENMAITEYLNFPFNSMCLHQGIYYGASADGIFILSGATDAGEVIQGSYSSGIIDYGTSNLKHIEDIIAEYEGDGILISVLDDTEEVVVTNEAQSTTASGLQIERMKPGRGLKSRAYGIDVVNINGGALSVRDIELRLSLLQRKIF